MLQKLDALAADPNGGRGAVVSLLQEAGKTLPPRDRQQPGAPAQIGITPRQRRRARKQGREQAPPASPLLLRRHGVQRHAAAVKPVGILRTVETAGQHVDQQRQLVHFISREGRGHGKAQMSFGDAEHGRRKALDADLTAAAHDTPPVDLRAEVLGKQGDIADLPDPDAAVQKMLVGVADQIQQMVGRAEGTDALSPDGQLDRAPERAVKQAAAVAIRLGVRREGLFVQLDTQSVLPALLSS